LSDKSTLELQQDNVMPQSLKDNEAIKKLMDLYFSNLKEQQELSEDPVKLLDINYLISKNSSLSNGSNGSNSTSGAKFDNIKSELFKIHLDEIYKIFENVTDSESIYNRYKKIYQVLNLCTDNLKIDFNLDDEINGDYITASKSFKSKKGTKAGFFFVNDIVNKVNIDPLNSDKFFQIDEGYEGDTSVPFCYTVKASLYKEVYKETILPLSHPVGFYWHFTRLLFLTMEDYFGLEQTKSLSDATLTCYGDSVGNIQQQEIVNSKIYGEVKNFEVSVDQDKNECIIIDYNPLDGTEGNGLRLVREYNGRIILYDRQSEKAVKVDGKPTGEIQYLEITEARVPLSQNGILKVNKIQRELLGETFEVIKSIEFKEYTIIDKPFIDIEYKIRGDKKDNWNKSRIYYEDFAPKVVSDDFKFFNPYIITRSELLDNTSSYNGRIVEDKGNNCLINYKATYSYKVTTKDINEYIKNIRPQQTNLPRDVNDIDISQSEYDTAISEGRDPYEGLYSNIDHTVQEENYYDSLDNWARLAIGNIPREYTNYKYQIDKIIGSDLIVDDNILEDSKNDWVVNWGQLNIRDIGFNSNDKRWEQFYIPEAVDSLSLINSTTPVDRFIRENLEWENSKGSSSLPSGFGLGYLPSTPDEIDDLTNAIELLDKDYLGVIKLQSNGEYVAWEDYNMDVCYTYTDPLDIQVKTAENFYSTLIYKPEYEDFHYYLDTKTYLYDDPKYIKSSYKEESNTVTKINMASLAVYKYWTFEAEDIGTDVALNEDTWYVGMETPDGPLTEERYKAGWNQYPQVETYFLNDYKMLVGSKEHYELLNAEVYKGIWNYDNGLDDDNISSVMVFSLNTPSVYKYWTFNTPEIGGTIVTGEDRTIEEDIWYIGMPYKGGILTEEQYKAGWNQYPQVGDYFLDGYNTLIGSDEHYEVVNAEVYKGIWNYDNGLDDDNILSHVDSKAIVDTTIIDSYIDKDGIAKSIKDKPISIINKWIDHNESLTNPIDELLTPGNDIADDNHIKENKDLTKGTISNKEFTDDMWDIGDDINIENELFYIGRKAIIKEYIDVETYSEEHTYWVDGRAYKEISSFNTFSDQDDFSFGVYRDNVLLEDNNIQAAQ